MVAGPIGDGTADGFVVSRAVSDVFRCDIFHFVEPSDKEPQPLFRAVVDNEYTAYDC